MKIQIRYIIILTVILIITLVMISNHSNNNHLQAEVITLRYTIKRDIQKDNLIGKEPSIIIKYFIKRNIPCGNYETDPLVTSEPRTVEARIRSVAYTLDFRGPQNWNIVIEFHFNERNRLKGFEIIEEGDGF